jgi:hypothetical protein
MMRLLLRLLVSLWTVVLLCLVGLSAEHMMLVSVLLMQVFLLSEVAGHPSLLVFLLLEVVGLPS